jgi:hypothetical protein
MSAVGQAPCLSRRSNPVILKTVFAIVAISDGIVFIVVIGVLRKWRNVVLARSTYCGDSEIAPGSSRSRLEVGYGDTIKEPLNC